MSATSQPAHSRDPLKVHVLLPLGPATACTPSASSWRLPARFQAWVKPAGGEIVTVVAEESIDMQPTSIAFATEVVTPGTVPDVADAPETDCGVPSRGELALTPE